MPAPGLTRAQLVVTIDRAAGTATMRKGDWWWVMPAADLPARLRFYRRLWARKPGKPFRDDPTPGPWARAYEDDVRVLEAAVRESMT